MYDGFSAEALTNLTPCNTGLRFSFLIFAKTGFNGGMILMPPPLKEGVK